VIILSGRRSQVIRLERREWAVLEDVPAILDIIPCFLRTSRFIRLDRRFNASIDRDRHGGGFDRGELHSVIFQY
jgi:hypothetical protein